MLGPMEPLHPCRVMFTRHCPAVYDGVCGDRPCARYESEDAAPWLPELAEQAGGWETLLRVATWLDRDTLVRGAVAAGVSKNRIHTITGVARTTIDRILRP